MGIRDPKWAVLVFLITFAAMAPSIMAHVAHHDEEWKKRAAEAWNNTLNAYEPNPEKVNAELNMHANKVIKDIWGDMEKSNTTRRQLRGKVWKGVCKVTNPIDRCWRCQPNWADNRKRLADCALGFGRNTIGGKNGEFYVVTDSSDDVMNPKPGTLRYAVIQDQPLWIIFARSMTIRLHQELIMKGDKTIDGRGAKVHIANGAGITIQFVKNVIIHGIHIHDIYEGTGGLIANAIGHLGYRTKSDGDGISVFGSSNVWLDHLSMWRCKDGIIDVVEGSTAITISNSHFTDHNEVMLFGASDSSTIDKKMQVTVAFNHFGKRLVQRMPRCRFGYIHVVNNDYTHWNMYAIGGSQNPTIISQGNRFIAPPDIFKKEVTKRDYATESTWKNWNWRSEGDLFMNGAFFVQSGDPEYTAKHQEQYDGIRPASGSEVTWITRFAGSLSCWVGKPC